MNTSGFSVIIFSIVMAFPIYCIWDSELSLWNNEDEDYLSEKLLSTFTFVAMVPALYGLGFHTVKSHDYWFDIPRNWVIFNSLICLMAAGAFYYSQRKISRSRAKAFVTALSLLLIWLVNLAGLALLTNSVFDKTTPQRFATYIMNREVESSKSGSYGVFYVVDWKDIRRERRVRVDWATFNSFKQGDSINVMIGRGFLGAPWVRKIERSDKPWFTPKRKKSETFPNGVPVNPLDKKIKT